MKKDHLTAVIGAMKWESCAIQCCYEFKPMNSAKDNYKNHLEHNHFLRSKEVGTSEGSTSIHNTYVPIANFLKFSVGNNLNLPTATKLPHQMATWPSLIITWRHQCWARDSQSWKNCWRIPCKKCSLTRFGAKCGHLRKSTYKKMLHIEWKTLWTVC